jgi:hypothetical protein
MSYGRTYLACLCWIAFVASVAFWELRYCFEREIPFYIAYKQPKIAYTTYAHYQHVHIHRFQNVFPSSMRVIWLLTQVISVKRG